MRLPTILLLLGLSSPATAGIIVVPADQPTLQAAINAASPGETILIQTSVDQHIGVGLLTVDKPLIIIGDPVCNILVDYLHPGGVSLQGPGSGELTLVNTTIGYVHGDSNGAPLVFGGGFDTVRLVGCSIRHDNLFPTGALTLVYPAVDLLAVPLVVIVDSELLGGPAGTDSCQPTGSTFNIGQPGLQAPQASVFVTNSTISGGRGGTSQTTSAPCDLPSWRGKGGDGIVAAEAHVWDSTIAGGAGADWYSYHSGVCDFGSLVACGSQPDGQPLVITGATVVGGSRLQQSSAEIDLGSTWSLSWDGSTPGLAPDLSGCSGSCLGYLYMAFAAPAQPLSLGAGYVYLDPGQAFLYGVFPPAASSQLDFQVPLVTSLIGLPLTSQVLLGNGELSGATFGILVP